MSLQQQKAQPAAVLDGTDLAILRELSADGRITNAALAARVGVAESTCTARVRALRALGVVTGIHAHLDPDRLGLPIQAVVKVRLGSHDKAHVLAFHDSLRTMPGVVTAFHVAGADDYLVHVVAASPQALRDLVLDHLTVNPAVRHVETHLVFEVLAGPGALAADRR